MCHKGVENLIRISFPLPTDTENSIVLLLISELYSMFSLELSNELAFDRRAPSEDQVFEEDTHTRVLLVGASHLQSPPPF